MAMVFVYLINGTPLLACCRLDGSSVNIILMWDRKTLNCLQYYAAAAAAVAADAPASSAAAATATAAVAAAAAAPAAYLKI